MLIYSILQYLINVDMPACVWLCKYSVYFSLPATRFSILSIVSLIMELMNFWIEYLRFPVKRNYFNGYLDF